MMVKQLVAGEDLRTQFADLAVAEAEGARDALTKAGEDSETAIHDARKSLKKLRSLLRLARPSLGEAWRGEDVCWRDVGRGISESRDAAAMVEAFDDVAENAVCLEERPDFASVREALVARRDALATNGDARAEIEAALRALGEARSRLAPLSWPESEDDLETGLRKSYGQFRRAWKKAKREGGDDDLHSWRKRTKDHAVHVGLMRDAAPQAMKRRRDHSKELADLLGKDHDLAVLRATIEDGGRGLCSRDLRQRFLSALEERRQALRRDAFRIGKKLCREKPRDFAHDLVRDWSRTAALPQAAE